MTNPEGLSYVSILQEVKRLDAYLHDQNINLPEIIYNQDQGVIAAENRLKVLEGYLEIENEIRETQKRKNEEVLAKSAAILREIQSELVSFLDGISERSEGLHHSHRQKLRLIVDATKKEL